jgi:DNA-binding MarR family transcriptional regulator
LFNMVPAFLDDEPALSRLIVVESLGAGSRALERRARVISALTAAVDEGRAEVRGRRELPSLTAEGVVGAVLSVIHARLVEARPRSMVELTGALTGVVVLPYLGHSAAEREVARPAPAAPRRVSVRRANPLRELDMRLTHRTVNVLVAIGERPGSSNREIATAAGVADQGQISKLLARLARLGLVENSGEGHGHGAPNAWALTERGREVREAIGVLGGEHSSPAHLR